MATLLRPFVTVVSGLPRSGTSLVMRMLGAGGMPLLVDDARRPDADNPRGYFEYGPVRRIASDASFIARADGRAIKVVAPLLRHLPASNEYRVLLLRRDLEEVIASQEAMLARGGAAGAGDLPAERLAEIYAAQVAEAEAWIEATPGCRALRIQHVDLIRDPAPAADAIDAFLGGGLDCAAMARAVDPPLHRQRSGSSVGWT